MTLLRKNESFMGQVIVELSKIRARTRGFTIGACTICSALKFALSLFLLAQIKIKK